MNRADSEAQFTSGCHIRSFLRH